MFGAGTQFSSGAILTMRGRATNCSRTVQGYGRQRGRCVYWKEVGRRVGLIVSCRKVELKDGRRQTKAHTPHHTTLDAAMVDQGFKDQDLYGRGIPTTIKTKRLQGQSRSLRPGRPERVAARRGRRRRRRRTRCELVTLVEG